MTQYMHYRGTGPYTILDDNTLHTETEEILVIYQNPEGRVFARPKEMFFGTLMVDGQEILRFTPVEES